ncbi:MAG: imidazoleglycerol-phosphate dehydratase HisB [Spirochaetia bacterium]|jgi:imidazoleglycerol-phosphate dehydratase|nr:imidazoleglycerol-phosphate dehydratase HisB [Spirochaetia bacterium]
MASRIIEITRKTKETNISLSLNLDGGSINISTGIPFFDHLLTALAFHGNIGIDLHAKGDIEVDPHHLVEDTGLVLGSALRKTIENYGSIARFAHTIIPMDEALSEITIDVCGRPYLVYKAEYPQEYSGQFQMALLKEFFAAISNSAGMALHAECRYGENSHHMAESLFKALGKAIKNSFTLTNSKIIMSTKGKL